MKKLCDAVEGTWVENNEEKLDKENSRVHKTSIFKEIGKITR